MVTMIILVHWSTGIPQIETLTVATANNLVSPDGDCFVSRYSNIVFPSSLLFPTTYSNAVAASWSQSWSQTSSVLRTVFSIFFNADCQSQKMSASSALMPPPDGEQIMDVELSWCPALVLGAFWILVTWNHSTPRTLRALLVLKFDPWAAHLGIKQGCSKNNSLHAEPSSAASRPKTKIKEAHWKIRKHNGNTMETLWKKHARWLNDDQGHGKQRREQCFGNAERHQKARIPTASRAWSQVQSINDGCFDRFDRFDVILSVYAKHAQGIKMTTDKHNES